MPRRSIWVGWSAPTPPVVPGAYPILSERGVHAWRGCRDREARLDQLQHKCRRPLSFRNHSFAIDLLSFSIR
eukprot:913850-Pleurochrysis_carterae.AAC.8